MRPENSYFIIKNYYGDRCAKRSGVPLMNHIKEGRRILRYSTVGDDEFVAFDLHPIFQADRDLAQHRHLIELMTPLQVMLVMEYRNIANASLSDIVVRARVSGVTHHFLKQPIKVSPLPQVNKLLVADKIQNRKDFEIHHKGTHPRSAELDFYFREWLKALGISEGRYQQYIKDVFG